MKGNASTDNFYNTLRRFYLVHLTELELYGKVVNINKQIPPNKPRKQNIKNL